ncbi:uncharacterized protein LOC126736248 isoform X2 [Anthonomus grandis grandis]|uniref:uncharacterized protein LOC126736248 isoform X2 n=1 Tax=Anthonomus grandis grandis TaxID=2921223 RepID=UPI00216563DE|nr:uncharacterized protein LOC126736248 isoform X2 [Anthonomus grandis grandis]
MARVLESKDSAGLLPLDFRRGDDTGPQNPTLQKFLKSLSNLNLEFDCKEVINEIVRFYKVSGDNKELMEETRSVIIELFTRFNGKKQLKKHIQDLVINENLGNEIVKATAHSLLEKIKNEKTCDLKKCNEFLHFISVLQTTSSYNFEENFRPLFPLYMSLFDNFAIYASQIKQDIIPEIEELNIVMNAVLKQILPVFVKNLSFLEEIKGQYLQSLLMYSYILLFNTKIGFDLRMKVCLIFVYAFNILEGDSMSVAQLISKSGSPFNLAINPLDGEETPTDYLIIIYASILCVLPENRLITEQVDGKLLICVLFEGILDTAKSNPGHSVVCMETSRALCHIAKYLKNIPQDLIKEMFLDGLFYVSSNAEHFIDTVRHYARIFFDELVGLAAYHQGKDFFELTDILIEKIQEIPEESCIRFYAYESIARYYGCDFLLKKFEHLPLVLLDQIDNQTVTDQVCKTYQMLVEKSFVFFPVDSENNWAKTWVLPAINVLKSGKDSENFCQKIISTAFRLQPAILRMIFPSDYVGTVEESKLLLHCLHNARKSGIELTLEKDSNLYWRGLIDKQKMDMYMIHQNEEIRLLVLASIAESLKSTELYLDWEFIFLINFIRYNITAQSPNVRKQIVSYYKKVLTRYDAGIKVIQRNIVNLTKKTELNCASREEKKYLLLYQELKKSYRKFICNLTRILIGNLSYDSNFPRRATSLELLLVIKDLLGPDEWKSCWQDDDVKNSHNILFDSYENNKKMIVKLLKTLPPQYLGFLNANFTVKYLQRSFEMALDVKPSKTLSAAYLFEVCSYSPHFKEIVRCESGENANKFHDPTLDMIVVLTRKLLDKSEEIKMDNVSVTQMAVYGLILSVRHMLENRDMGSHNDSYKTVFSHLVSNCFKISEKIMPVVCNPSPEGYLPDNVEEIGICDNDESPKSQRFLVYAWRTMKEMTLLLAELVKQSIKLENQLQMLPQETLKEIGEFFVNVFVQSRHRGVFEQAYVGFSTVCEHFWRSSYPAIAILPKKWLREALELCTGKKHSEDLCATRRSAGLPFLILSILTTGPDPNNFHKTMTILFLCAEDHRSVTEETRMHCLNVLRAIFRHSKLGELVASYVARGVILAIGGFKSESWGVRNSSTLLYAALMTRMFGVQRTSDPDQLCIKNKLTVKVFFTRYQQLHRFILASLAEECQNKSSLILQPILMILARLYPSNFDEGSSQVSEYLPYIDICLSNPEYRTREAAAKASVALINVKDVKSHFDKCFQRLSNHKIPDNECHGTLLQMHHILKSVQIKELPISEYLKQSAHIWEHGEKRFSHMTVSLYTELVTSFLYIFRDFDDLSWLKRILLYISKNVKNYVEPLTWKGNFALTRTLLACFIIINKLEETNVTYSTITNEIIGILYGRPTPMKKYYLELLICLNQMHLYYTKFGSTMARLSLSQGRTDTPHIDQNMESHALFSTGDVEITSDINDLVKSFNKTSVEQILKHIHMYLKGFLMEELKIQNYIKKEDRVLLFLLLNYYPCAIKFLRLSKQETLNTLLSYCDCDNEELISAVISCISTFLTEVDYSLLKYDKLLTVLSNSASPAAALHRRLTVCDFLCKNYSLYCNEEPVLKGDDLCKVLNIVMVLLEDEDLLVRNAMSNFENALKVRIRINNSLNQTIPGDRWPVVPEKAKEDLIHLITVLLPQEKAVCMIFSWACRYFPDPCSNESQEIFERGGANQYAENTPLIDICSRVLIKMLWALPEGLSYDDRSIFPEEQTQIVTTILLNSLTKYDSPMMGSKTKMSVICGLKSIYKFLENSEISPNFCTNFRTYLNDTILNYLTNHLEHGDLFCVKKIIRKLYDPVFRLRR